MEVRPTAATWRRLAAILALAWMAAMLPFAGVPGLPVPALGGLDWRTEYLGRAASFGSRLATFGCGGVLSALGVLQHAELGARFLPLTARAWLYDATAWGA